MHVFKLWKIVSCFIIIMISSVLNMARAVDVIIILDTTGSTGALLPNWKEKIKPDFIDQFKAVDLNSRFALVSHLDFPFSPYGVSGEYAYRLEAPLDTDTTLLEAKLAALKPGSGGDTKESQYEAIFQAVTGLGRDLNGNGNYSDIGDIAPSQIGVDPTTGTVVIHFTSPLDYHNDPFEPDYPYSGVINHPATEIDTIDALKENSNGYYAIQPVSGPIPLTSSPEKMLWDQQTKSPLKNFSMFDSSAHRLAEATGGEVLSVGKDLEGLREVATKIRDTVEPCAPGMVPVRLPTGILCIPGPTPQ